MNGIRSVVEMLEHQVMLCKAGLHPDQLDNLTEELDRARKERWRQFQEGLDADAKREAKYKPKRRPESCLVPRSCDEWMDSHGNWHWQNSEIGQ